MRFKAIPTSTNSTRSKVRNSLAALSPAAISPEETYYVSLKDRSSLAALSAAILPERIMFR